jgi:hypothetical protein
MKTLQQLIMRWHEKPSLEVLKQAQAITCQEDRLQSRFNSSPKGRFGAMPKVVAERGKSRTTTVDSATSVRTGCLYFCLREL